MSRLHCAELLGVPLTVSRVGAGCVWLRARAAERHTSKCAHLSDLPSNKVRGDTVVRQISGIARRAFRQMGHVKFWTAVGAPSPVKF